MTRAPRAFCLAWAVAVVGQAGCGAVGGRPNEEAIRSGPVGVPAENPDMGDGDIGSADSG